MYAVCENCQDSGTESSLNLGEREQLENQEETAPAAGGRAGAARGLGVPFPHGIWRTLVVRVGAGSRHNMLIFSL